MPVTLYSKTKSSPINLNVLKAEIESSVGVDVSSVTWVEPDTLNVYMVDALTTGEETNLDNAISSHSGTNIEKFKSGKTSSTYSTSSANYVEVLSVNTGVLQPGDYRISWYAEVKKSGGGSKETEIKIELDDSQTVSTYVTSEFPWQIYSGFEIVTISGYSSHTVDFDYRMSSGSGSGSGSVKNISMSIELMQ